MAAGVDDTKTEKEKKSEKNKKEKSGTSTKEEDAKKKEGEPGDKKTKKRNGDVDEKGLPDEKPVASEDAMAATLLNAESEVVDESKQEEAQQQQDLIPRPLKWHPDEIHCSQLCPKCLLINYRWPPPPPVYPPPDKDPNLIYPGDVDPDFKPSRGDVVMFHPKGFGLESKPSPEDLWWKSTKRGGGYCVAFDGDKKFHFEVGDLVLRIGSFESSEKIVEENDEPSELEEGKRKSSLNRKGSKAPKPRKIADPPQLPGVTYKPYEKLELYTCSGFEVVKEEAPLDVEALEAELRRVFEANTEYLFDFERKDAYGNPTNSNTGVTFKDGNPIENDSSKKKSIKASNLDGKDLLKKKSVAHDVGPGTNLVPEVTTLEADDNNKLIAEKVESGRKKSLRSTALEASQASLRKSEAQEADAKKESPEAEKQPKIKLIWTFLGSQSQLQMIPEIGPVEEPKCPGLGCFYQPYLNLGSSCKMEHSPVPNIGEILIPEGVWLKNFNHRKNEWRSMVKWYVPPTSLEEEPIISGGDLAPGVPDTGKGKAEKAKRKNSKDQGPDNGKVKENQEEKQQVSKRKSKVDKGDLSLSTSKDGLENSATSPSKKEKGKGKPEKESDKVDLEETSSGRADNLDNGVQMPEIEEQELTTEKIELDFPGMPEQLKKELVPGMILLRPLVGRQLYDDPAPIEEWKWPRKKKIWGSVEMYMVEWGGEGLGWVYWGRSDRLCDTAYPSPPLGAKLKFLHPADAKIDVPVKVDEVQQADSLEVLDLAVDDADIQTKPKKDKTKKNAVGETKAKEGGGQKKKKKVSTAEEGAA